MTKEKNKKASKAVTGETDNFLKRNLFPLLIFAVSFLLYANSISNNYNLDDELVTIQHKLTSQGFKAIPEIISSPYYSDNVGYAYEYRPVVHISFAIEHGLFGENPHTSHFFNVLLYALLCVLLFFALRLLLFEFGNGIPLVATLLFAVHPIHTEVVNSIKNRDEILAMTSALWALIFALRYIDRQQWFYLPMAAVFFAMGLLSKQSVLSFVVLIPIAIVFFRKCDWKQAAFLSIFLFIPLLIFTPLNTLKERVALFVAGAAFIAFVYLWRFYSATIIEKIDRLVNRFMELPKRLFGQVQNSFQNREGFVFHPDNTIVNKRTILIAVGVTLVTAMGMFYLISIGNTVGLALLLTCFIFFGLLSSDVYKQLLFVPVFLLTMIGVSSFGVTLEFFLNVFLLLAMVYVFIYKHNFRWSGTIVILLSLVFYFAFARVNASVFFDLLSVWMLTNKKFHRYLRAMSIFVIVIGIFSPLLDSLQGHPFQYDDQIRFIVALLPIIVTYRPAAVRLYPLFSSVALIFTIALLLTLANKERTFYHSGVSMVSLNAVDERFRLGDKMTEKPVKALEEVLQTPLKSENTDRPLAFIETPVLPTDPASVRIGTSFVILGHYLYKAVVPYPMSYYYGYRYIEPTEMNKAVPMLSFFAYLLLFILALWLIQKQPVVSFAMLFYLVSVVVFSNYAYPVPGLMGDRFLLIPSLGWCLLLPALLQHFFKLPKQTSEIDFWNTSVVMRSALILVFLAYSALTFSRNFQWKDPITLFSHDINYVHQSAHAHNLLALRYNQRASNTTDSEQQKADYERGIHHFRKAVEIYPDFFNVNYDLGRTYLLLQKPDSAGYFFQRAAVLDSTFMPSFDKAGEILFQQRKFSQAVPYFMHVVKTRPTQYEGYDKLSFLYYTMGEYEKAIAVNRDALRYMPQLAAPYINLGRTYQGINQVDSAAFYYERALALQPGNTEVRQLLEQIRKAK